MQTQEIIEQWLIDYLSKLLEIEPNNINIEVTFSEFGLDSITLAGLLGDLNDFFKIESDVSILYNYPTIKSLSGYMSKLII